MKLDDRIKTNQLLIIDSALFLFFAIWFVLWRYGHPVVWDDTNILKQLWIHWPNMGFEYANLVWLTLLTWLDVDGSGYRPVARTWTWLAWNSVEWGPLSNIPSLRFVSFVGAIIGIFSILYRRIGRVFIQNNLLCVIAVFLYLFSTPVTQSNWIFFAGLPILIPFLICVSFLWFFSHQDETITLKYILGFVFLMLFGVWYREVFVLVPLMLMVFEFLKQRRCTRLFWITAASVPFCLLPTLLPRVGFEIFNLICIRWLSFEAPPWLDIALSLPVLPSFFVGNAGAQLTGSIYIRSDVSHHFLSLMAPTLLVTTFVSFFCVKSFCESQESEGVGQRICNFMALVLGSLVFACLIYFLMDGDVSAPIWVYHLGVITILLISLSIDIRLFIWISAFLFPFYLVYTERVHLAYVLMPLVITLVAVNGKCWVMASGFNIFPRTILRTIISVGFCIGALDAISNPVSTSRVMTGVTDGITKVGGILGEKHEKDRVNIISNVIHADDLRLFSEERFTRHYNGPEIYLTVRAGHDGSIKVIDNEKTLREYLSLQNGVEDVYFLDVWHSRLPEKRYYHRHNFVATCSVEMGPRETIHETIIEYRFFDPLRYWDGRRYFAFLGPPDLQDDFYFGPSEKMFHGRVYARYDLYEIDTEKVDSNQDSQFGRVFLRDPNGIHLSKVGDRFKARFYDKQESASAKGGCPSMGWRDLYSNSLTDLLEQIKPQ